jgi:hypothetical protein
MFNRASSRTPLAAFAVPPHPPAAAAKAIADFERVADAWGQVLGEIDDAKAAAEQAKAQAKSAAVEAVKSGKPTKVSVVEIEQKYEQQTAELEAREAVLRVAVDEVGNTMALAVAEDRSAWLTKLEEVETEAESRYANAIKEAQAALGEIGPARAAVRWLSDFQSNRARHGLESQFAGGRVRIEHKFPGTIQSEWDPKELLAAANEVVSPTPKPELATSRGSA